MQIPELKQLATLSPEDFARQPVWIGVHNYDSDEPWHEQSDEETFRPWTGQLPFNEQRGSALVATRFALADGSTYGGYCQAVRHDWDLPPNPYTMPNGFLITPQSWSARHGGTKLSVLSILSPTVFVCGRPFGFGLGVPKVRKRKVRQFYSAIQKKPCEVFPVRFAGLPGLANGVTSGTLEGFFYFPMGGAPFEIDTGESLLAENSGN